MKVFKGYEFWFITGSQHLYGEEVLKQVEANSRAVVSGIDGSDIVPGRIVFKMVAKTAEDIVKICKEANFDDKCAGIITWCHTFSPSKMWITGLKNLNKPWLQLHTQFNEKIPADSIDMDFMNLNQAAHGDREHGFIGTRLRMPRKIVVGFWQNEDVLAGIGSWMRSAVGIAVSRGLKVVRFGDNMRQVAVTEGDKVEAEIVMGWSVNSYGVGDLAAYVADVTEEETDGKMAEYAALYDMDTDNLAAVRYQARVQVAMEKFLEKTGAGAFTTSFEDLHGLEQLPGLACQDLMRKGYCFGGEGDWKTAAMGHIMKRMAEGIDAGTSFMEDYTYDLSIDDGLVLGAHMLEICPSIAKDRPRIQAKPLSIGGKDDPAWLVFEGQSGPAILASLIDMGDRLRLIVNDVECVQPPHMPKLPVAATMWKPLPNLAVSAEAWMRAGGAHHSILSFALTAEHMRDFAETMGIEFVHIHKDICIQDFKRDLFLADAVWKLC